MCCIYNRSIKNKRMMFWCTYNHRIIEYGVGSLQRKKQGPEYYVINPRSYSQDDQLSAIQLPSQCSFHVSRRPRRDRAQWALPFAPASATVILGPLPLQHNFYFSRCIFRLLKTFKCILFQIPFPLNRKSYYISFTDWDMLSRMLAFLLAKQCHVQVLIWGKL